MEAIQMIKKNIIKPSRSIGGVIVSRANNRLIAKRPDTRLGKIKAISSSHPTGAHRTSVSITKREIRNAFKVAAKRLRGELINPPSSK